VFKRKNRKQAIVQHSTIFSRQVDIEGLPDMDWGAPDPVIRADEHHLSIAYYLSDTMQDTDGTTIHVRDSELDVAKMALFKIDGVRAFAQTTNGPEHSCPYLDYGESKHLGSHDVWEMQGSRKRFPLFSGESRDDFKHLIFAFHDTSVECFCKTFKFKILVASAATVFDN